ncbi:MAG: enoyl-CoA hydratase-related protein [Sphingobium sp.]
MVDAASLLAGSQAPIAVADGDGVRFVILNRPAARNAMTRAMRADFSAILAAADADPAIAALVLTGAAGIFSSGVDLKDRVPGAPPVEPNPGVALRRLAKPIIAAIDGPCVTGALEMALSCTFAIATPAARFADTHCKVGLFPRWGGGALLTGAIGVRRARQMMLTGDFVDADTALSWGLVNEIVPAGRLLDRAAELARAMADRAREQPLSFRLHEQMLCATDDANPASAIEGRLLARFDTEKRDAEKTSFE